MSNKKKGSSKNQIITFIIIVAIVVILMGTLIFFALNSKLKTTPSSLQKYDNKPVSSSVLSKISNVSISSIDASLAGSGVINNTIVPISNGKTLYKNKLPRVVYIGADYCPFCAAERWALVISLSKFGTFQKLHYMTSSAIDIHANTPTFTFYKSEYSSKYIDFTPVETETNQPNATGSGYLSLMKPTNFELHLFNKYDSTPYVTSSSAGSIPFVDTGGKYLLVGAQYSPSILKGLDWNNILSDIYSNNNTVSETILSSAAYLTKYICKLTNGKPQKVCQGV